MSTAENARQSPLQLADTKALCDFMEVQAAKLTLANVPAIAALTVGRERLLSMYNDALAERAVEGWAGWLHIADEWLIKVTEDQDGVWLMLRGPESTPGPSGRTNFEAIAFRKEPHTAQADMLRKLKLAIRGAM